MKDVNKVILVGRLGKDPVLKATKNGTPVSHFPVATSRRVNDSSEGAVEGAKTDETQWHRVVAWGKQGELCAQYLRKGQQVYIEGSVRSRKYETQQGEERFAFEVHAENVSFLGSKKPDPVAEIAV